MIAPVIVGEAVDLVREIELAADIVRRIAVEAEDSLVRFGTGGKAEVL